MTRMKERHKIKMFLWPSFHKIKKVSIMVKIAYSKVDDALHENKKQGQSELIHKIRFFKADRPTKLHFTNFIWYVTSSV